MVSGLNFWDSEVWTFVVTLAILLGAMLTANWLRQTVKFLRKSLIPSPVLGGFLVLFVDAAFKAIFGHSMFVTSTLEALTYHGLGLGFVALAWRHTEKIKGKKARRDVFNTSTITVGGYLIQGAVGLIITIALFYLVGSYAASGVLLPMGYGQGPGQAYNWGHTFEMYTEYTPFRYGTSFGLTVAAMGFIAASIGGVIYLNKMREAGDKRAMNDDAELMEDLSVEQVTGKNEIPLAESMDKMTVQIGLVFITYFISYALMYGITLLLDNAGSFVVNTVKPLLWGFNFLVGTAVAVLLKSIGNGLRKKGVMKREYTNNFMLNRISGLMFDIMVVASIAAIDLSAFKHREFWLPLLLVCIAGAVVTYFYTKWMCKRLFPDYTEEMFLAMYGMLTGTASTGIILLREVDPLFKTPASHNVIYQNLWSIILGAPMLLLMGFVARSMTWTWITLGATIVLFGGIVLLQYRRSILAKMKRDERRKARKAQ